MQDVLKQLSEKMNLYSVDAGMRLGRSAHEALCKSVIEGMYEVFGRMKNFEQSKLSPVNVHYYDFDNGVFVNEKHEARETDKQWEQETSAGEEVSGSMKEKNADAAVRGKNYWRN